MLATSTTATRWKKGGEKRLPKDCSEFQCKLGQVSQEEWMLSWISCECLEIGCYCK